MFYFRWVTLYVRISIATDNASNLASDSYQLASEERTRTYLRKKERENSRAIKKRSENSYYEKVAGGMETLYDAMPWFDFTRIPVDLRNFG